MGVANAKLDVVNHLKDNWDDSVCDVPEIVEGDRQKNLKGNEIKRGNYVNVFDDGVEIDYVTPDRLIRDEYYRVHIELGSTDTSGTRDNILSETERILGTGMTGYDNRLIQKVQFKDSSADFFASMEFIAIKYNQSSG